jgi:hypothetical protein
MVRLRFLTIVLLGLGAALAAAWQPVRAQPPAGRGGRRGGGRQEGGTASALAVLQAAPGRHLEQQAAPPARPDAAGHGLAAALTRPRKPREQPS